MPLLPIAVLTYTSAKPGAESRLVHTGDTLAAPGPAPHGTYRIQRLEPSAQLLAWAREGARFDLSRTGAARVWSGGALLASECALDCAGSGVAALGEQDVAYLEAYLFSQGRPWSDSALMEGEPSPSC